MAFLIKAAAREKILHGATALTGFSRSKAKEAGHAYTIETLLAVQHLALENIMPNALRLRS
jgi:hypothetical protein